MHRNKFLVPSSSFNIIRLIELLVLSLQCQHAYSWRWKPFVAVAKRWGLGGGATTAKVPEDVEHHVIPPRHAPYSVLSVLIVPGPHVARGTLQAGCIIVPATAPSTDEEDEQPSHGFLWAGKGIWTENSQPLWHSVALLSDVVVLVLRSREAVDPNLVWALIAGFRQRIRTDLPKGRLLLLLDDFDEDVNLENWRDLLIGSDLVELAPDLLEKLYVAGESSPRKAVSEILNPQDPGIAPLLEYEAFPRMLDCVYQSLGGENVTLLEDVTAIAGAEKHLEEEEENDARGDFSVGSDAEMEKSPQTETVLQQELPVKSAVLLEVEGIGNTAAPDTSPEKEMPAQAKQNRSTVTTAEPVEATTAEPVEATTAEPVEAEPVGATTAEPVGATTTEPVGATTTEPVGATTTLPVGATTTEPVEATTIESVEAAPVDLTSTFALLDRMETLMEEKLLNDDGGLPFDFVSAANPVLKHLKSIIQDRSAESQAIAIEQVGLRVKELYDQHLQTLRDYFGKLYELQLDKFDDPAAWKAAAEKVTQGFRRMAQNSIPKLAREGRIFRDMNLEYVASLSGLLSDMVEATSLRQQDLLTEEGGNDEEIESELKHPRIARWYEKLAVRALVLGVNYLQGWLAWQGIKRAAMEREHNMPKFPLF